MIVGPTFQTLLAPEEAQDIVLSIIRRIWPDAVLEDEVFTDHYYSLGTFVYKDKEVKKSWDEQGRTDENASKIFHMMCATGRITVDCNDQEEADAAKIFEAMSSHRHSSGLHAFRRMKE